MFRLGSWFKHTALGLVILTGTLSLGCTRGKTCLPLTSDQSVAATNSGALDALI